jgi:hypothetical protein
MLSTGRTPNLSACYLSFLDILPFFYRVDEQTTILFFFFVGFLPFGISR